MSKLTKVQVSVRSIQREISKAEKKLRALRRRIHSKAGKKQIDCELRLLNEAKAVIPIHCFAR
jgi:hypothetical protein